MAACIIMNISMQAIYVQVYIAIALMHDAWVHKQRHVNSTP